MKKYLSLSLLIVLCACSTEALFPSTERNIVTTPASQKVTLSSSTSTVVGQRVTAYKNELNNIRSRMNKLTDELAKVRENPKQRQENIMTLWPRWKQSSA